MLQSFLAELFLYERTGYFEQDIPSYRDETKTCIDKISEAININITNEYSSNQINEDSIAFHRVEGIILAELSYWYFSTKQFRQDLLVADANPRIIAHFVSVNSGGGEAWFLDVAADTMKNLKKPVIAHYENVAASAAIYLSVRADKIYAATPNEIIGSIGTMVSFLDIIPYYEKLGIKKIEEYADQSDLKNKKYNDLINGKPGQFIKEELNPLAEQFIKTVSGARPKAAKLGKEHPLFRGETFDTPTSISLGLIDGQMLIEDALIEAYTMGINNKGRSTKLNEVFNL